MVNGKSLNSIGITKTFADLFPLEDCKGRGKPFLKNMPLSEYSGVLSVVLQISKFVKSVAGVMRESTLNKFFVELDSDVVGFGFTGFTGFTIEMPLFQINLVPDLMQVYFLPDEIEVEPIFEHFPPGVGLTA